MENTEEEEEIEGEMKRLEWSRRGRRREYEEERWI